MVQPGRPQMTVWRMHIACWIPKATNTHSEYVILIAFPLQQWLHERTSIYVTRTFPVLLYVTLVIVRKVTRRIGCDLDDQGIAFDLPTEDNSIAFTPFISVVGCHPVSSLMDTEG